MIFLARMGRAEKGISRPAHNSVKKMFYRGIWNHPILSHEQGVTQTILIKIILEFQKARKNLPKVVNIDVKSFLSLCKSKH